MLAGTIAELTYPRVASAAARGAAVLLPVGVIEEHGPHLPLATDVLGALQLCRLVAQRLAPEREAVIAPPFTWGVNHVTSAFPGSFRTRSSTAAALLEDMITSLHDDGFATVLLVNHHGDHEHNRMLVDVVRRLRAAGAHGLRRLEGREMVERLDEDPRDPMWALWETPPQRAGLRFAPQLGVHAHDQETALVARWFPHLVDWDALRDLEPTDLDHEDLTQWRRGGDHAARVTPDGYFGAPRPIDPDLWRIYEYQADAMARAALAALRAPADDPTHQEDEDHGR